MGSLLDYFQDLPDPRLDGYLPKWIDIRKTWPIRSMIIALVNPHSLGFTGFLKTAFALEINGFPVDNQDLLVEVRLLFLQLVHNHPPDALSLVIG